MALHFQSDPNEEVVTDAEMEEIVRRVHQVKTTTSPADVAEALGITESDVRRMLADIRRDAQPEAVPVVEAKKLERRRLDFKPILAYLGVMMLTAIAVVMFFGRRPSAVSAPTAPTMPMEKFGEESPTKAVPSEAPTPTAMLPPAEAPVAAPSR